MRKRASVWHRVMAAAAGVIDAPSQGSLFVSLESLVEDTALRRSPASIPIRSRPSLWSPRLNPHVPR